MAGDYGRPERMGRGRCFSLRSHSSPLVESHQAFFHPSPSSYVGVERFHNWTPNRYRGVHYSYFSRQKVRAQSLSACRPTTTCSAGFVSWRVSCTRRRNGLANPGVVLSDCPKWPTKKGRQMSRYPSATTRSSSSTPLRPIEATMPEFGKVSPDRIDDGRLLAD